MNSEGPHISGADDGTAALRGAMVDRLKPHIIRDPRIEAAFRAVPRHLFLPTVPLEKVYSGDVIPTRFDDKRVPISSSSEVAVMAVMIEQLELVEGQRVLEIGAGTGYNAAIIAQLVRGSGRVTTIEIDPEIAAEARARLDVAGYERVHVVAADGWDGLKDEAPHDRIVLTASTGDLSPAWVEQLADHGILLVPLWMRAGWQMLVAFRRHDGALRSVSTRGGGFMALRGIGAPVNPGVSRNNFHVVGAHQEDFDGIFALLETDPNLVLGPPYEPLGSFERQTALGAAGDELISISHVGRGRGLGPLRPDGKEPRGRHLHLPRASRATYRVSHLRRCRSTYGHTRPRGGWAAGLRRDRGRGRSALVASVRWRRAETSLPATRPREGVLSLPTC